MAAMKELVLHERFEIEILELLKNKRLLSTLVFGGGTMLRLCHELPRYSVDLDFWFFKKIEFDQFDSQIRTVLSAGFELTDAADKKNTLLYEIRKAGYPRRLKIEIRKELAAENTEQKIAFSTQDTRQILLRGFTLNRMMENKIAAFLDRREVRDGFDIEFLIRRGVLLSENPEIKARLREAVLSLKPVDFKVKLASLLEEPLRSHYASNGFKLLLERTATGD